MKVVYISGKYRSQDGINGIYENIQAARAESIKWWKDGYAVICPHMNTAFMDGAADDSVWLKGDLEFVRRSDIIVMLNDWEDSEGARAEHEEAIDCGLEIIYQKERDAMISETG